MGQATADLPDPLEAPAPASMSGTDDLLAQLAGDEIDRLLAEAGVELPDAAPPARAVAAPVPAPPAPKAMTPTGPAAPIAPSTIAVASVAAAPVSASPAALPAVAADVVSPPPPPLPAPVAIPASAATRSSADPAAVFEAAAVAEPGDNDPAGEAPVLSPELLESDAELDALLDEMSRAEQGVSGVGNTAAGKDAAGDGRVVGTPEARPPEVAVGGAAPPAPVVAKPLRETEVDASEPLMSAAEREALSLTDIAAATDAAELRDAATLTPEPARAGPSLGVRLLELLNAPLAFVPDGMRDALGKIAILTLVNSLAVLIYVLFLRG